MCPSTVTLCVAIVLLHGVSCHLFPEAIINPLSSVNRPKNYKRQTLDELRQCITTKFNAAFPGNTSRFVSNCRLSATREFQINVDAAALQAQIDAIYPTFCVPECGNVILKVYDDCGYWDILERVLPGIKQFTADLCSTNENGEKCYKMYGNAFTLLQSESTCYATYKRIRLCSCQSLLSEGVSEQGCCINVYHNYISGLPGANYSPRNLYNACNVDRPADCNNSPISGSIFLFSSITLMVCMVFFAALC